MNYAEMTIEALEQENQKLSGQRSQIRKQQKVLVAVLDQKRAQHALAEDLDKLNKKHGVKAQVIAPKGIESEEVVKSPVSARQPT